MAQIRINNASLIFKVRRNKRLSIKEWVVRWMFRRSVNPIIEVRALEGISFRAGEGEKVGVIGANGAGKSTLLRMIAGIYKPTSGQCLVNGKVSSLFDLALGFELDASGWENMNFRGYLQGETPRTIEEKKQAIAEFSELGDFLDMPVRYYSAGMLIRLAFSIATTIEPEVLLVDEVLAAGDLAFQHKARDRMREVITKARLMVLVSHDLEAIKELCTMAVWLDHGRARLFGPVNEVVAAYTEFSGGDNVRAA